MDNGQCRAGLAPAAPVRVWSFGTMDIAIRRPRADEIPALRHIWETAFGSGDIDAFFCHYFDSAYCAAASYGGVLAASGYLLPAGDLVCGGIAVPCAMIYAVAALPEFRNRGFGAAVVSDLIAAGRCSGYPAIVLCPSEDSLFGYYSARSDFRDWFYIAERRLDAPPCRAVEAELITITADEYAQLRADMLKDIAHIDPDALALSYQIRLCGENGGGLFRIVHNGGVSCAAIERDNTGTVWIRELLSPAGCGNEAFPAIAKAFPAQEYIVRTPAQNTEFSGHVKPDEQTAIRRFGMLSIPPDIIGSMARYSPVESNTRFQAEISDRFLPWFGFAFD